MKHLCARGAVALTLICILSTAIFAAEHPNYSGTYLLRQRAGKALGTNTSKIHVAQGDVSIEIIRTQENRKTIASRFPLNGSEGTYTSPDGVSGRGKARFKGDQLLVESEVDNSPKPGAPPVGTHTHERWQLSPDSKILTIKYDVDLHVGLSNAVKQSWTETYVRTKK